MFWFPWIQASPISIHAGSKTMACPRKLIHVQFTDDFTTCVENAANDSGILVWDIPSHETRPKRHGDSRNADVIFEADGLSREDTVLFSLNSATRDEAVNCVGQLTFVRSGGLVHVG